MGVEGRSGVRMSACFTGLQWDSDNSSKTRAARIDIAFRIYCRWSDDGAGPLSPHSTGCPACSLLALVPILMDSTGSFWEALSGNGLYCQYSYMNSKYKYLALVTMW